ncbi:MAG: hypothetical protein ACKO7P_08360 [Bacteroidota bacterium]
MIIFITGPDRCGKDTLIRRIRQEFKNSVFHQHHYLPIPVESSKKQFVYEKEMNDQYFAMIDFYIKNKINIIYNRCHIDSMVYAPIYRGYSNDYLLELEKKLDNHNFYLITLVDDLKKIIQREDGESQNKGEIFKLSCEIENHKKYFSLSSIKNKLLIDMSNQSLEVGLNLAIDFIKLPS